MRTERSSRLPGPARLTRLARFPRLGALAAGALSCAAVLAGCSAAGPSSQSITGTWTLSSARDAKGALDLSGVRVTLKIDGARSGGQGPCNGYGETISGSTTGRVELKRGVATTMGCLPDSRMALESRYFAMLDGTVDAVMKHGDLVLSRNADRLEFTRG